jgi:hypothetical protein
MLSKINQAKENKYCIISLICELKKKADVIEVESRMVVTR